MLLEDGIIFDYDRALEEAESQLDSMIFSPILLKLKKDEPKLTQKEAFPLILGVQNSLYTSGVLVKYADLSWNLDSSDINNLFEIRRINSKKAEIIIEAYEEVNKIRK